MPVTALLAAALSAASPSWALPVDGAVAGGFAYDRARPFAAGARRGVDLRAAAGSGSPVRAACSGRVSHAGRVPRWTAGVSVRCGRLVATHLGLRGLVVRRGERVRRGQRIGRVGPAAVIRLGARVSSERFGWVDPLTLVAEPPPRGAPLGPAPPPAPPRVWRHRRPARPPTPRPVAPPSIVPSPPPASARRQAPALAWVATALVAAGLPVGPVLAARHRRRRRAARTAAVAAEGGREASIF